MANVVNLGTYDLDRFQKNLGRNGSITKALGVKDEVLMGVFEDWGSKPTVTETIFDTLHKYSGAELIAALILLGRLIEDNQKGR